MKRLTRKTLENGTIYSENGYQCLEKLYKLEDIEEQLGCPLEVVFKALKNGAYLGNGEWYCVYIEGDELYFYKMCIGVSRLVERRLGLNGYKKTWWLKEDKSE